MKHQALFSSKDKSKKMKMSPAAILLGALRVKPVAALLCLNMFCCSVFIYQQFSLHLPTLSLDWSISYIQ